MLLQHKQNDEETLESISCTHLNLNIYLICFSGTAWTDSSWLENGNMFPSLI